jgi:hypothetical protein
MSMAFGQQTRGPGRWGLLFLVLSLAGLGCGTGKGDVTGKVTYQNKPLTFGTVTIQASDGAMFQGNIESDGTYTVRDVPVGEAKVAVSCVDPNESKKAKALAGRGGGEGKASKGGKTAQSPDEIESKGSLIPEHYGDIAKSPLRVKVEKGVTNNDIPLQDPNAAPPP